MLPHYALEASDEEHRRLVALAFAEGDRVVDACARSGVGAGATVLDLGCGPLGAMAALSQVVGAEGAVIGIDASDQALGRARALMPPLQFPALRLVNADVNDVSAGQLGVESADAAYCRLFLMHQSDPVSTVRKAARFLRSGGVLIAHEPSDLPSAAPAAEPHVPAMTRVWELVIAAARARGAQPDFGRRGRACLEQAGLKVESHRAYMVHYPPHVGFEIPRVALHSLRPTLEQHSLASPEEVDALDLELRQAASRPGVQWVSSPLMFEWIARKE